MANHHVQQPNAAFNKEKYLPELLAEKDSLDPSFVHCMRLLTQEIERIHSGKGSSSSPVHLTEKCFVPVKDFPGFNFVGRLLGPRGLTLKRMQSETGCRMTIMGRGSVRDPIKEEELRAAKDPKYDHLSEDLYVLVEAKGPENIAAARLAAGVAEVKKMLIPTDNDQIREEQLRELALLNGLRDSGLSNSSDMSSGLASRSPGPGRGGGRGGSRGGMHAHGTRGSTSNGHGGHANGAPVGRGGRRVSASAGMRGQPYQSNQYESNYDSGYNGGFSSSSGFGGESDFFTYDETPSSSDYSSLQDSWQKAASSAFRTTAAKRFHPYSSQNNF